jgi:hypothetical protein
MYACATSTVRKEWSKYGKISWMSWRGDYFYYINTRQNENPFPIVPSGGRGLHTKIKPINVANNQRTD